MVYPKRATKPIEERFWAKVDKKGKDECWLWNGAVRSGVGHGAIGAGRTVDGIIYTHRLSYQIHFGEIPKGFCVCHVCDVPSCVNPSHLFLGTQKENIQDMDKKGRRKTKTRIGIDNNKAKLNDDIIRLIRSEYHEGRCNAILLANRFSVHKTTIYNILKHKIWRHVL